MVPEGELIRYSVVSSLRNQLSSKWFDDFAMIYGVKDQLERIKSFVESIESMLGNGMGIVEEDEASQELITSLKHVLLPADDYFELIASQFLLKPYGSPKVRDFFSFSSNPVVSRLRIHRQINKMQKDFHIIVENLLNLRQTSVMCNN